MVGSVLFNYFRSVLKKHTASNKKVIIEQHECDPEIEFEMTDELNLEPGIDNSTDDPVRMYLREMGSIEKWIKVFNTCYW